MELPKNLGWTNRHRITRFRISGNYILRSLIDYRTLCPTVVTYVLKADCAVIGVTQLTIGDKYIPRPIVEAAPNGVEPREHNNWVVVDTRREPGG